MSVKKVNSTDLTLEELAQLLDMEINNEPKLSKVEQSLLLAERVLANEIEINPPSK